MSWVLQSNKSRNFDFSMLLSLTIDRSACIRKPLIAEAVHCICKDKGFEGSLSIARKNCILFLQYFFLYLSIRRVITSLTRKSLASKGLLKIYAHIKMADPTLISFRTLFFYLYGIHMADFIGNLIMILIFTLSDFFERLEYLKHTETIIYKKKIDRF